MKRTLTKLTVCVALLAVGTRAEGPGEVLGESKLGAILALELDEVDWFGAALASAGDVDGDGCPDLVVGCPLDDDGGSSRGAVYVLFLDAAGAIRQTSRISATTGGFAGTLDDEDRFGAAVAGIGDIDGNGVPDLAVGAPYDDDAGPDAGAVWLLALDVDGRVIDEQKIVTGAGLTLGPFDGFGAALAPLGDIDGNATPDLAVGATFDDDGGPNRGAVWLLGLGPGGSLESAAKISATAGGFTGTLDDYDEFGAAIAAIGDLDGDGIGDLAVGAPGDDVLADPAELELGDVPQFDFGAVWVLLMRDDGTVREHVAIAKDAGGFTGFLDECDDFGNALAPLGDLDGDGVPDLAVGAPRDDDGGFDHGAGWVLLLAPDGTVREHQKISDTMGDFAGVLDDDDWFGAALATLGDLDGDGLVSIAVGATLDDDLGEDVGAVWMLEVRGGPVTDLGAAWAGPAGAASLSGAAASAPDAPPLTLTLALDDVAEGVACALVVGWDVFYAPLKQGVMVPTPNLIVALAPGDGISLPVEWPDVLPDDARLYVQAWLAGAPGYAASNALMLMEP